MKSPQPLTPDHQSPLSFVAAHAFVSGQICVALGVGVRLIEPALALRAGLDLDELQIQNIADAVFATLGVLIHDEELEGVSTVGDFARMVEGKSGVGPTQAGLRLEALHAEVTTR